MPLSSSVHPNKDSIHHMCNILYAWLKFIMTVISPPSSLHMLLESYVSMPVQCISFFHIWFTPIPELTQLFETIPIQSYHSLTCLHQLWHWIMVCTAKNPWIHIRETLKRNTFDLLYRSRITCKLNLWYIKMFLCTHLGFHTYKSDFRQRM